jgi:NADPH:quinone reductase-like Zn-dependent oxidoreductase
MIDTFKTPGHLDDVPRPEPGPREVRIRVTAAGVNPVDWKIRSGSMPSLTLPRVLGQDIAGVVDAIGSEVTRFAVGDRVLGCARSHGAYAEETIVPENTPGEPLAKIPDEVDDATASALPTPGLTALACLNAANVAANSTVLIVGAAGAVGAIATQLAVVRGAHVIATVKPADGALVRAFGAQTVIESTDAGAIVDAVKSAAADGVSAIIDMVSDGATLKTFGSLLSPGGTIVTTIHVADEAWFREQGAHAVNLVMSATPESSPAALDELTARVATGELRVSVSEERPLGDARAILDGCESHELHGKFVLLPAGRG